MKKPTQKRIEEISKLPSTWSDIDFSTFNDNDKLYWFENRRLIPWLLNDTKQIKEKAESMFGLAAMVCIGIEFISKFRYAQDKPNIYFPMFVEEYVDSYFKKTISNPYSPNPPPTRYENWFYQKTKLKYSEIFYFGLRNQLTHNFMFRHTVLIEPIGSFLKWERKKKRLLVDSRYLHIKFDNSIRKYIEEVWKSDTSSNIYQNFFKTFVYNYERKF